MITKFTGVNKCRINSAKIQRKWLCSLARYRTWSSTSLEHHQLLKTL